MPDPAYVGIPIWMQVISPTGYKIHYPSSTTPNDFYCNEVEVKQDGHLLRPLIGLPAEVRGGPACGWLGIAGIAESKLPIHLEYLLTEPGMYMVRFTRREYRQARQGREIAEQSGWTPLHLQVAPPGMIERWLTNQLSDLPAIPGRLLGDTLPSLLASRDRRVLQLMIESSYDADPAVAAYAANSLKMFDPEQVRAQLLLVLRERGPNDALGYLFSSRGNIALPIASQIVATSEQHLRSPVPVEVEAAVHVLSIMRDPYFHLPAETVAQAVGALQSEVDFVVAQKNDKAAWWIANFLGQTRPPVGRVLLWKLKDAKLATEQSLICVTWFQDPSDLPQLAEIAKQYSPSDPHGYAHSSVVMHMQTQYGTVALPYLRDILASSKQTWVRTSAAQGLVQMNDRAGWEFFIDMVRQRPFYRDEMVRWLGEVFPVIRNADDVAISTFLTSRLSNTTAQQ
ncbi:MAG: hypothetical protein WA800_05160 [Terriglobales bacterium]